MDIFVTNKNDFAHEDRFNGIDYLFPAGERVLIPEMAATHMFGYGRADKTENLVRLGWANKFDEKLGWIENPEGIEKLRNFIFTQGIMVEIPAPEKEFKESIEQKSIPESIAENAENSPVLGFRDTADPEEDFYGPVKRRRGRPPKESKNE